MAIAMVALSACSDDQQDVTLPTDKEPLDALYFVPLQLPAAVAKQSIIIRLDKQQLPNKAHRYWHATVFTMPGYAPMTHVTGQFIDTDTYPQLLADTSDEFILHIPEPQLSGQADASAVWVRIKASTAAFVQASVNHRWLPILLTPDMATVLEADKKRRSKLAIKLADKAYFFGYATNEAALE